MVNIYLKIILEGVQKKLDPIPLKLSFPETPTMSELKKEMLLKLMEEFPLKHFEKDTNKIVISAERKNYRNIMLLSLDPHLPGGSEHDPLVASIKLKEMSTQIEKPRIVAKENHKRGVTRAK